MSRQCILFQVLFFRGKTDMLSTFCSGRPYVRAKSGLFEDFSQNIFNITPPEKCTWGGGGGGPRICL